MLILTALNGSQRGSVFEFPSGTENSSAATPLPVTLGRKSGPIPFHSSKVSGHHAELSFENGQWFVRDLGSRNGTKVNRRPISEKTQIKSGDLLQIARHYFTCSIAQSISSETSHDLAPADAPPPLPRNLDEPRVSTEAIEATVQAAVAGARDAVVTNLAQHESLLQQVLARLQDQNHRHGEVTSLLEDVRRAAPPDTRPLLEQIGGQLQSHADKHRQSLDAVWKALEQPSKTEPLFAAIRTDLESQNSNHRQLLLAMQAAVESQSAKTIPLIEKLHARLDEQDGRRHELLDTVRDAVKTESAQTAPLLEKIRSAIDAQAAKQEQSAAAVQRVLQTETAKTHPLLEKIQTTLDAQSARQQQVITDVQQAVDAAAVKTKPLLEKIQTSLDAQSARQGQVVADVQQAIDAAAVKTLPVLEKIQAGLDSQGARQKQAIANVQRIVEVEASKSTPLLEKIQTTLDAQGAKQEQVVAAVQHAVRTEIGSVQPLMEKIGAQLDGESGRHAELVAAVRQAAAPGTAEPVDLAPLLERITAALSAQESRQAQGLSELRESIAAIPGAGAIEPKLEQITTRITDQFAGQVESQAARHAELTAAIKALAHAQPGSAEPLLKEITNRLDAQAGRHTELLDAIQQVKASVPAPAPEPVAPLLEQIGVKLAAQESRHGQVMAAVQSLAAAQPVATERVVRPIITLLETQASQQATLVSAVQALAAAEPKAVPTDPLLRRVAEQLESQAAQQTELLAAVQTIAARATEPPVAAAPVIVSAPVTLPQGVLNIEPQLGQIADMLRGQASRQAEMVAAVQAMAASEPRGVPTHPLLRRVAEQVESQLGRQEIILAALHRPQASDPALARIDEKLDAQAARQEDWAARVESTLKAAASTRDDATLEGLTAQLATQWAQVREAIQTDKPQPLLETVAAQLKAQEAQQTVMMERIHEKIIANANRTDPNTQHMIAKLETLQAQLEHLTGVVREMTLKAQTPAPPQTHVLRIAGLETAPTVVEQPVIRFDSTTLHRRSRLSGPLVLAATAASLLLAGLIGVGVWEHLSLRNTITTQLADLNNFKAQMSQQVHTDPAPQWMAMLTPPGQDDEALDIHPLTPLAPVAPVAATEQAPGIPVNPSIAADATADATYSGSGGGGTVLGKFGPDNSIQVMTSPAAPRRATSLLTSLQKAFRYAYDTGWPIVVGGKMDPSTGKLAGGRTLDPATARRLGFKTWQDWYAFDDANEKLRLQQAAQDFLEDRKLNPIKYLERSTPTAAPQQDPASE